MKRPNVLLICVDHWPGRLLGTLGHPAIITPTLNRLAANGVHFTNAYSTTPVCIAARRELHTGTYSPTHGDRNFAETMPMPALPTLAETFRAAGYQTAAAGKLHVYPQRNPIGFAQVRLDEEGRHHLGLRADDFEQFLAAEGYAGQEFAHGMGSNDYCTRTWHLPEYCHPTNWTVRELSRMIHDRDPQQPGFWYASFRHPHPPLVPLPAYMEIYRHLAIPNPYFGTWTQPCEAMPYALRARREGRHHYSPTEVRLARQAFYALCTHIDHQIRLLVGLLREEGLLDDTVILFTGDHGDMLGNHGLYAKDTFYEDSAKIPLILVPTADDSRVGHHQVDWELATLADVMPTLLDLCGIPIPESVEGVSLVGDHRREFVYGEQWDGPMASRMLHDGRHKLIYYPVGNRLQLFDLARDPNELQNVADLPACADLRARLTRALIDRLYGGDEAWADGYRLVGLPDQEWHPSPDRGLGGQRGLRFL